MLSSHVRFIFRFTIKMEIKKNVILGKRERERHAMQQKIEEISIRGSTFVTIDRDEDGLLILTHPDTEVTIEGKTLFIKDPVVNMGATPVSSWRNTLGNVFNAFIGYPEITNMIGNVDNVNVSGVFYSNVQMGTESGGGGGASSATKKECRTPHHIACDYANIRGVVTNGSMRVTFLVPLDTSRCDVTLRGTGSLSFPNAQSFMRLGVFLYGTGDIDITTAATIGTVRVKLEGTGDIVFTTSKTMIDNAKIESDGTGDIEFGGARIDTASVALTGTGSVSNFSIYHDAVLGLTGTGTIECSATRSAKIKQSKTGPGRIKVTRLVEKKSKK